MGKFYKLAHYLIWCLCASTFTVQALAQTRPSVTIDADTGRVTTNSQTFRYPQGTTIQPAPFNQIVRAEQGGLSVDSRAKLQFVSGSQSPTAYAPTTASTKFFAGASALRNAAARCLTSFRCNVAAQAAATGFSAFLDGVDWVMTEGAYPAAAEPYASNGWGLPSGSPGTFTRPATLRSASSPLPPDAVIVHISGTGGSDRYHCIKHLGNSVLVGGSTSPPSCIYSETATEPVLPVLPVNPLGYHDIRDALENYNPQPDDFPFLSGGIDLSDDGITIEGDFLELPSPIVTTEPQSDGKTRQTTSTLEPEFVNNPSAQPEIRYTETTEVTIFNEFGDIVSSSTSSSTSTQGLVPLDIPTDCEFMPTVCRFIEWFTEPDPEMLNEPDLKQLMETFDPDESVYDFGPENASCPEPYVISFSLFPSVEVSYQPVCDVADMVRPLVIALAYIFSGILLVRNI